MGPPGSPTREAEQARPGVFCVQSGLHTVKGHGGLGSRHRNQLEAWKIRLGCAGIGLEQNSRAGGLGAGGLLPRGGQGGEAEEWTQRWLGGTREQGEPQTPRKEDFSVLVGTKRQPSKAERSQDPCARERTHQL